MSEAKVRLAGKGRPHILHPDRLGKVGVQQCTTMENH